MKLDLQPDIVGRSAYILYGTHDGVYMFERPARTAPRRVLDLPDVTQIDVLEDHNLLIVLSGTPFLASKAPHSNILHYQATRS